MKMKKPMKWRMRAAVAMACLLWSSAGALAGGDVVHEPEPGVRQPTLRKISRKRDASAWERIEFCRAKLPPQNRKRFNFAWAVAKIDGLDKTEYFAHSSIQDLSKLSNKAAKKLKGISLRPEREGHYYTLCVNQHDIVDGKNCWQRNVDTEYKIIEDMVARLPDTSVKGRVKLYTDLPPCASCWNVLKQFMAEYTNVHVQVLYKVK